MSGYIFVCSDEAARHEGVELPMEEDGTLLLSVLQSQFEGASGLKYRNPTTGGWRAVKLAEGVLHPPESGWSDIVYIVVLTTPAVKPEPVGELGSEGYSVATTASPGVAVTTEGYKRKMEDQDGSRAAKNPRSSSPTFASLETPQHAQTPQHVQDLNREDLIILGLEWTVNDAELKRYFEQFGEVAAAEVKKDIDTGKSRGFGFVRYFDEDIQKKVQGMKHTIKGRKVDVKFPKKSSSYLPSKLFVGCLPLRPEVTREELEDYFGQFGELADVYIPQPYRGFGFVSFQDAAVAHKVLNASHTLRKSTLNISLADPKGSRAVQSYVYPTYDPYQHHYYDPQLYTAHQNVPYTYAGPQHPTSFAYTSGYSPRQAQPGFPRVPAPAQHADTAVYQQARPAYQEGYSYQHTRPRGPPPPPPPQSQAQRMQQQAQQGGQGYSQPQYSGDGGGGNAQYGSSGASGGSSQYSYGSQGYSYSSESVGYGAGGGGGGSGGGGGGPMKLDGQDLKSSAWQHY